jgi:hypothetical protein
MGLFVLTEAKSEANPGADAVISADPGIVVERNPATVVKFPFGIVTWRPLGLSVSCRLKPRTVVLEDLIVTVMEKGALTGFPFRSEIPTTTSPLHAEVGTGFTHVTATLGSAKIRRARAGTPDICTSKLPVISPEEVATIVAVPGMRPVVNCPVVEIWPEGIVSELEVRLRSLVLDEAS